MHSNKLIGENIDFGSFKNIKYFEKDYNLFLEEFKKVLIHIGQTKDLSLPRFQPLADMSNGNCGPFHNYFKHSVETILNCKSYLTIGYMISKEDHVFHGVSIEDIYNAYATKNFPSSHHVWLTLDSGEIFDMTFKATYTAVNNYEKLYADLLYGKIPIYPLAGNPIDFIDEKKYYPIAVGSERMKECGYKLEERTSLINEYFKTGIINTRYIS